jgi:amino-acid N-acetyltransferase
MTRSIAPSVVVRRARGSDWPSVRALLRARDLPLDGAADHLSTFVVAEAGDRIVGCAGLERYGGVGLVRSVAIEASSSGTGLGANLVRALLDLAHETEVRDLYLLTTTASEYFPKFGFAVITRDSLPSALAESAELRGACPASAVAMRLSLRPR